MSDFLQQRYEAIATVLTTQPLAHYEVPLRLISFSNGRGASKGAAFAKAEKVKTQRMAGERAGRRFFRHLALPAAFFAVRVIRIAPRSLDPHDNIGHACKAVIDGCAEGLGLDDRDPRVRYVVDQRKSELGQHLVRLELYAAPASRPEIPESSPAVNAAEGLHQRHTDECIEHLTDPGATCVCRPPAVAEPLVGRVTPNVRKPR
jgi:hypothetical protein